jgi:hypothetical protein
LLLLFTAIILHSFCLQACCILRLFNIFLILLLLLQLLMQGWPLLPALPALRVGCLLEHYCTIHAQHRTGSTTGSAAHIKSCHLSSSSSSSSSSIGRWTWVQAVCREQSRVWWHLS